MAYVNRLGRIAGKVLSCKIGAVALSAFEVLGRFKGIGWDIQDKQEGQFVAAKTFPDGWFQGHEHVEGELRTETEIDDVMLVRASGLDALALGDTVSGSRFINPGAANDECKFFEVKVATTNQSGTETKYAYIFANPSVTISGVQSTVLWRHPKVEVVDNETNEWVYPFKAKFVVRSGA